VRISEYKAGEEKESVMWAPEPSLMSSYLQHQCSRQGVGEGNWSQLKATL